MADFQMDYEVVDAMARGFGTAGDMLEQIDKVLQDLIHVLETTAFIGLVGGEVWACYLRRIEPKVKKLGESCREMSADLDGAVRTIRDGDSSGSQRFASTEAG